MLIRGNIIDIFNREIYPGEMLVAEGRVVAIKRVDKIFDRYILPGFIDSHVHIESSMVTPSEFSVPAVGHGTIAVVSDPHEIANVLGVRGVDFMIENSKEVPLKFFFGAPSCVPATSMESSGATIDLADIINLLKRDDIYYLSEMMNYPGVIFQNVEVVGKINSALAAGKPVDGHAPGLTGEDLLKYVKAGISTDHEAASIEEGLEKIGLGMKILIREGSAARNMKELAPLLSSHPEQIMFCSDDIHPEMLVERHINGIVRYFLSKGYDMFDTLRAASLNPTQHYKLDVGLLRVGDRADFIVVDNMVDLNVIETWIDGNVVFLNGVAQFETQPPFIDNRFNSTTIDVSNILVQNMHREVKVIEIEDGELYTRRGIYSWSDEDFLESSTEQDILKLVVKERYNNGPASVAFIKGFNLKRGAIASSVAHDSHNIIAVGVDNESIVAAINSVVMSKGGLAVYDDNRVDMLPLPIAGIMSDVPCGTIADKYLKLSEKVSLMGSYLKAPFMTLSFMALLVIPELKLGDRGLFDGTKFQFTDLFIDMK